MGTTLTGTTPQDTYDSLIKVTDNGPLSGSLKRLTDGLGNDSSLSLSTTAASFSGTLAVTGNATFDTSTLVVDATNNLVGIGTATPTAGYSLSVVGAFTAAKGGAYVEVGEFDRSLMVLNHTNAAVTANLFQVQKSGTGVFTLTSAGNVGIGTSSPAAKLQVVGGGETTSIANAATTSTSRFDVANPAVSLGIGYVGTDIPMLQSFNNLTNTATNLTINPFGGNIGMGTSSPAGNVHIASASDTGIRIQAGASNLSYIDLADTASGTPAGSIAYNHIVNAITFATGTNVERARIDSDGLKFNGDTAAANALDDYEEGTFTAALAPSVSGTITLTAGQRTCKYTKIGNKVSITGYLIVSTISSPVGGSLYLQGLPFTIASGSSAAGSANATFFDAPSYSASIEPTVFLAGGTQIDIVKNASLIGAGDEFYVSATYFV